MTMGIEEFIKIATPEQMQILFDLSELAEKENELAKKINNIYSTAKNWPGIYSDGEGITLCENEDDAHIISLGHKIELRDVREKIAILLKKAVKQFNMGDVGLIQRQYHNYIIEEKKEK